ncbi:DNA mismatch repair protein MutS, partial [Clostridium saudiense]|nr:DNA mismatch repair protein MutS [Clostridium saudiense]
EELLNWAREEKTSRLTIKYIPYLFISSTTIFIILALTNKMPATYLLLVFAINYLVVKLLTRNLSHVINMFIRNKSKVNQYSNLLSLIQDEQFKSYKLRELKRQLQSNGLD